MTTKKEKKIDEMEVKLHGIVRTNLLNEFGRSVHELSLRDAAVKFAEQNGPYPEDAVKPIVELYEQEAKRDPLFDAFYMTQLLDYDFTAKDIVDAYDRLKCVVVSEIYHAIMIYAIEEHKELFYHEIPDVLYFTPEQCQRLEYVRQRVAGKIA